MNINPIILSIPIYFLLIGIELLIQYFSKKSIYRLNDALTNIGCGITQQITGGFLKILTIISYQVIFENWALFSIPSNIASWICLWILVDFCYYWAHRKSHEINLFWGGHVVHHQSEDYNFSVALRQGSFQILWTFWFFLPLAFIGFNTMDFVVISALNTVYQFFLHTETIGKLPKPIEWIFNTPSHHRVHHGRNPKYIDKNHAGSLIIWDRLFGTFQEEEEKPTYGITKPIKSWNPVWTNLEHYVVLAKELRQTSGIQDRLKLLFYKPGWRPGDSDNTSSVDAIDSQYQKYDTQNARNIGIYVLTQFAVILILTAQYLFNQADYTLLMKLLISAVIIASIASLGLLMENRKVHWLLESLRTLVIAAIFYMAISQAYVLVLAVIFALVSTGSYYFVISGKPKALQPVL